MQPYKIVLLKENGIDQVYFFDKLTQEYYENNQNSVNIEEIEVADENVIQWKESYHHQYELEKKTGIQAKLFQSPKSNI